MGRQTPAQYAQPDPPLADGVWMVCDLHSRRVLRTDGGSGFAGAATAAKALADHLHACTPMRPGETSVLLCKDARGDRYAVTLTWVAPPRTTPGLGPRDGRHETIAAVYLSR